MGNDNQFVLFSVEDQQFAIPLHSVDRVLQIVKIEPLAKTPAYICGVINLEEELIPVINLRKIFILAVRDYNLSDQLIIFFTGLGKMALWVDAVLETVVLKDEGISSQKKLFMDVVCLDGFSDFNNSVVLISDPDRFIERDHINMLSKAIESLGRGNNKHVRKKLPGPDSLAV